MLTLTTTSFYPLFLYISFPFLFFLLLLHKEIEKKESKKLVNNNKWLSSQSQQKVSMNSAEVGRREIP